jgi:3,4-dihydroxy 2-butanone 4-phosphate synthase/GTP cyclohydrolase II
MADPRSYPHTAVSPIEEIIEEARNGRMFILVDDEDRENEGDLVIPAQMAGPDAINFMARHARGLICLAMTRERVAELGLPLMARHNESRHETAFTVSIEAREGVTTGISAHDRARTVAVAIDPTKGADEIVTPGHVFPLVAKEGGVLVRAGHTEAAVDISRLAGLYPAGVICEVMNDDGTMARLPDLIAFGQLHGLKVGTIADLIAYRRRSERLVTKTLERPFESIHGGPFRFMVYRNSVDGGEHVVLVKGEPSPDQPTLVRMHQLDFTADVLGETDRARRHIPDAMKAISDHDGPGVIVFLRDPALTPSQHYAREGAVLRDYGVGAQILREAGAREMTVITSNPPRLAALEGYGLKIIGWRPLDPNDPRPGGVID